jgi:F-type H+-transporting ATPase subunit b
MSFMVTGLYLFFAGGESGFMRFYNDYLNIPGFEAWRFLNLAVFLPIAWWGLNKMFGVSERFRVKRDAIRSELVKAEEERLAALAQLKLAEEKIAGLEAEREQILKDAKDEAAVEKKRLAAQTKADIERMKQQMQSELSRLTQQTHARLRRFSAEESVRLAEEKLRGKIGKPEDARLVKTSISEIGGLN